MNLIPAKQLEGDKKVGFYDTVSEEWFFTETETDFVAGPAKS